MALIPTSFNLTPRYFPYSGLSDPARDLSHVPSGEVRFFATSESIPAPGVGNNNQLIVICQCPLNSAYVLIDLSLRISAVSGDVEFDDQMTALLADTGEAATRTYAIPIPFDSAGQAANQALEMKIYTAPVIPQVVVVPGSPSAAANLTIGAYNTTVDGDAHVMTFFARFLRYGIEQAHHYAVSTPQPVRP